MTANGATAESAAILQALPVGIWVARAPDGHVTYANPEFHTILGMDAIAELGIDDAPVSYGIFDRSGRPHPVETLPFSRVLATGGPVIVDTLVVHRPDGRKVNVRAFADPIRDAEGRIDQVVVAFVDITAEVKAQVEREEMGSRIALAVNHTPIVIWCADAAGVVTVSEGAGLKALGVRSGQLVGSCLFHLYEGHPDIPGYLRRGLAGESFAYTVQVGDAIYDTWLTPVRDAAGTVTGIAGISHDVGEIRHLQAKTIQADRAIVLGTLASSVAHEINNPLTYMMAHLEDLSSAIDRLSPRAETAGMRNAVDAVMAGTRRIAHIAQDLLALNTRSEVRAEPVDAGEVIRSVLNLVGKRIAAHSQIHLDLRPAVPIQGDAAHLMQVVLNLLVNALYALPEDRIATNRIWLSLREEGEQVLIEVADNGPGVPAAERERIFEPFVTSKASGEGTGLGLFVCRTLLRGMSGNLTVGERAGGGAVFRVLLPGLRSQS